MKIQCLILFLGALNGLSACGETRPQASDETVRPPDSARAPASVNGQYWSRNQEESIRAGMTVSVHDLDSTMADSSLASWLQRALGPDTKIRWEMNDCGEATGTPADSERDLPVCVQANASLSAEQELFIMVGIGTMKRGLSGIPGLWGATIVEPDTFLNFAQLSALEDYLAAAGNRERDRWIAADRAIVRLPPGAFPELPRPVRDWLEREGFKVPQSFCEPSPHNILRGPFLSSGQEDWVVLGSRRDTSEILVFPKGSPSGILRVGRLADAIFLQGVEADSVEVDSIAFSRLITPADSNLISTGYADYDTLPPFPIRHQGIDDNFCGTGSVVYYWQHGRWHELPGSY